MLLESSAQASRVLDGLGAMVLEQVDEIRVVDRRDHPVEHPLDAVLHGDRLVQVLHELLLDRGHAAVLDSRQPEPADLAAGDERPPAPAVAALL